MHDDSERGSGPSATVGEFPVVGIGASAGGLAACEELLAAVPADMAAAFVIVQHLDPSHESHLVPLLSKITSMEVVQAEDGMAVAPRCVYVIPPNASMTISRGLLHLGEREQDAGQRMPIDAFLHSLAEDQGEHAVAVILSGTGSDGSTGIRSIESMGGLVVVQDPVTAQHDGMPRAAIETGFVDSVGAAAQIPTLIRDGLARPIAPPDGLAGGHAERDPIGRILSVLLARTRADFRLYKRATIRRRVERRMGMRHVSTWPEYLDLLRTDPDEASRLSKDLLIRVTSFFREPDAFEALRELALEPLIQAHASDEPIRVWVPGCATGEEAYSIVMLLQEEMARLGRNRRVVVFATDLDENALDVARRGVYPESIEADVSPARLSRFFRKEGDCYRIEKTVRESVVFAVQNLISDPAFSRVDLVSCRNLLIYLEFEVQKRIFSLFDFALNPGGILFLGTSDSLNGPAGVFQQISKKWRLFRHLRTGRLPAIEVPERPGPVGRPPRVAAIAPLPRGAGDLAMAAHLAVLEVLSASVIVADRAGNVVHLQGPTARYMDLPSGAPGLNVLALARGKLAGRLRSALRKASTGHETIRVGQVPMKWGNLASDVDVTVRPLPVREGSEALFAIVLREVASPAEAWEDGSPGMEPARDAVIEALESELSSNREEIQAATEEFESANEELKAASEEVMSMNEELQSTNEELETSKEELQSLNEELSTVNAQLQEKLEELTAVNDDLANLFASTDIATVFLDTHLRVKRFTPSATALLKLIPADVGHPISRLSLGFDGEDLTRDAETVLNSLQPIEREIRSLGGAWFVVRVLPYRTHEGAVDGVVVTFANVTRLKLAEEGLKTLNDELESRIAARTSESDQRASQLRVLAAQLTLAERNERQRISRILHDQLQQLLIATKIHLDLLRRHCADDGIRAEASRAAELLDQCIEESRSLSVELSPPLLREAGLVAGLRWLANRTHLQHGLQVEVEVAGEETVEPADPDARVFVFEVVRELLFNVVKHAGATTARVVVGRADGAIEVRVEDQGRGFDQADRNRSTGEAGGLGLFSIRERAEYLGGSLAVESALGRGTRAAIRVPAGPSLEQARVISDLPAGEPSVKPPRRKAASGRPDRIRTLLADDHDIVRAGFAALLGAEEDIEIVGEAADGPAVVEMARNLRPDVIVMDIGMPRMNGVDATRLIHAEQPGTRIIGLSMHEEDELAAALRDAGAVAYLTKGGASAALIAAIRGEAVPL